ncbi:OLC1v1025833C2 [Oldenlandia corymbosa var. corymbosa]|uniref:OLC1v1025833C2 n=1 Tax=Oldenlandia corymbosa var. corymbosa TaxID=529605 RepID=A0AAV1C6B4_OLDCO|nr:OLC1v1025833C2 [Oldenlandia corymbosa var. corymbosa]
MLYDIAFQSFSLDKSSGKKCFMLAARDLSIVWSDTPAYWKWIPLPESRFNLVAELVMVCWLEIRGAIKASMLSPDTNYAAYLVFTRKSGFYGFDHPPAETSVGFSGQEHKKHDVQFDPEGAEEIRRARMVPRWMRRRFNFRQPGVMGEAYHHQPGIGGQPEGEINTSARIAKRRADEWMEVELGEVFITGGEDMDVEISLLEVKGGNWKSGLAIEGIEIRPKERK